ncbi:MAG: ATP-dependent Clp protease proteolytic subunit [Pseudomonadota bacterium]
MNLIDLLWIPVLIVVLQPLVQRRLLEGARRRIISRIEARRQSRVITLVHRQETVRFLGVPVMRYIDIDDAEAILRALHMTDPETPVDLILHTPGGLVLPSLQIAFAIKQRPGKVTVFVPHYAMSGGTLIALAADEIVMSRHAVLGAIDPQVDDVPAASVLSVVEKKPLDQVEDSTLVLADVASKALEQVRRNAAALLVETLPPDKAEHVVEQLTSGQWTHDYPITAFHAATLGLPVNFDMPNEVFDLMALYPQPTEGSPTVEYLRRHRRPK